MTQAVRLEGADKATLRKYFISHRQQLAQGRRAPQLKRALSQNLKRFLADLGATHVAVYRPARGEATFDLGAAKNFFFPKVEGEALSFYRPTRGFTKGAFGLDEPSQGERWLPSTPLVCLCPAVAVDLQGRRLGMGKGFYDRFFNQNPDVIRVGVIYQVQLAKFPLPADRWDHTLDWIVTEQMILRTLTRSH